MLLFSSEESLSNLVGRKFWGACAHIGIRTSMICSQSFGPNTTSSDVVRFFCVKKFTRRLVGNWGHFWKLSLLIFVCQTTR